MKPLKVRIVDKSEPKLTQLNFDSAETMFQFKTNAINFIEEHVTTFNPKMAEKSVRSADKNKPFFMYLAFRAPHAPYSHNMTDSEIRDFLPYSIIGKPGEQIGLLDNYVGQIMAKLEELDVADNTFVVFTSDNGPDSSGFHMFNTMGHIRTAMLRGKKAASKENFC